MNHFTEGEASKILKSVPDVLLLKNEENSYRQEIQTVIDHIYSNYRPSVTAAAVYGFVLGRATGIREERQKRADK